MSTMETQNRNPTATLASEISSAESQYGLGGQSGHPILAETSHIGNLGYSSATLSRRYDVATSNAFTPHLGVVHTQTPSSNNPSPVFIGSVRRSKSLPFPNRGLEVQYSNRAAQRRDSKTLQAADGTHGVTEKASSASSKAGSHGDQAHSMSIAQSVGARWNDSDIHRVVTKNSMDPRDQDHGLENHTSLTKGTQSLHSSPEPSPLTQNYEESLRSGLQVSLSSSGSIKLPHIIHHYTLKYVDPENDDCNAILKLVNNLFLRTSDRPKDILAIGTGKYITLDDWGSSNDAGITSLQTIVFLTQLYDAEVCKHQDGKVHVGDGSEYTKVFSDLHSKGKPRPRWLKVELLDRRYEERPDKGKVLDAINSAEYQRGKSINPRMIGFWFEHKLINVGDIASGLGQGVQSSPQRTNVILSVLQGCLKERLVRAGMNVHDIVMSGTKAFTTEVQEPPRDAGGKTLVVPSSLVQRTGLNGSFVCDDKGQVTLAFKPCATLFFRAITVSDFVISFYGEAKATTPDPGMLKQLTTQLRGIKISVPVKSDFGKMVRTIQSLEHSPVTKPKSLHGLKAGVMVGDLRNATMPCVDVGTPSRPCYFPAELCLILPNQLFRGKIPSVDQSLSRVLDVTKNLLPKPFSAKHGDPFSTVGEDDFQLHFAAVAATRPVRTETLDQFRDEVGQRFNGKLRKAVTDATTTKLKYRDIDQILSEIPSFTRVSSRAKNVLVLVVSDCLPASTVDAIRVCCETKLGVQCCVVNAKQLERRYHHVESKAMVMYTGQIVRKIFARAKIPGTPDHPQASPLETSKGRLFGIHVSHLQDLSLKDMLCQSESETSQYFLATAVSVVSDVADNLCTTHRVFKVNKGQISLSDLAPELETSFNEHRDQTSLDGISIQTSAIYVSGVPSGTEVEHKSLRGAFERIINPSNAQPAVPSTQDQSQQSVPTPKQDFNLIIVSPEKQLSLADDVNRVPLQVISYASGTCPATEPLSDEILSKHFCNEFDLHQRALNPIYVGPQLAYDQDGKPTKSSRTWQVVYQLVKHENNDEVINYFRCVERRHLPSILHLAQAASKRCRSRVYLKEGPDETVEEDSDEIVEEDPDETAACHLEVTPVHKELEHSLHYI